MLIRPIIVVKFLAFWTRWIFPKEFRNPETFSNLEKALDLLDKNPSYYETQYDSQITLVKLTGGISLLIFSYRSVWFFQVDDELINNSSWLVDIVLLVKDYKQNVCQN